MVRQTADRECQGTYSKWKIIVLHWETRRTGHQSSPKQPRKRFSNTINSYLAPRVRYHAKLSYWRLHLWHIFSIKLLLHGRVTAKIIQRSFPSLRRSSKRYQKQWFIGLWGVNNRFWCFQRMLPPIHCNSAQRQSHSVSFRWSMGQRSQRRHQERSVWVGNLRVEWKEIGEKNKRSRSHEGVRLTVLQEGNEPESKSAKDGESRRCQHHCRFGLIDSAVILPAFQ